MLYPSVDALLSEHILRAMIIDPRWYECPSQPSLFLSFLGGDHGLTLKGAQPLRHHLIFKLDCVGAARSRRRTVRNMLIALPKPVSASTISGRLTASRVALVLREFR